MVETNEKHAVARMATPNETISECLAVECSIADWKMYDPTSKPSLARLLVQRTTKTSGVGAQNTCIGGHNGLNGHLECPVCGVDIEAMPAGIDLPTTLPSSNKPWSLAPELVPEVNSEIASQVQNVLCTRFVGVKADKIGKAMGELVTGETIRSALEARSLEWMQFIDGYHGLRSDGVKNMEAQLLVWLRNAVDDDQASRWKKARLLTTLQSVASATVATFKKHQKVLAQWMVADPSNDARIIVDPTEPRWLSATVLGKGRGIGTCYRLKFSDGHVHPGVPYANIRRVAC